MRRILLLLLTLLLLLVPCSATGQNVKSPEEIAAAYAPAVVLIVRELGNDALGVGTGFFVQPDIIATNFHVVQGSSRLYLKLHDGIVLEGDTVFAFDEERDLALIKLSLAEANKAIERQTPLVVLGDSDRVRPGQGIVVISNPRGILESTVSNGLVSAIRKVSDSYNLFQISAPVSPGSSGGPVFDAQGHVIAVVVGTLKGEGQNLNFAVPVSYLNRLFAEPKPTKVAALPRQTGVDREPSPCPTPVYVVGVYLNDGTQGSGWFTKNMKEWWDKEGKRKYPGLCFVDNEETALFRLEWKRSAYSVPMYNQQTGAVTGYWGHADVRVTVYMAASQQLLFTNSHHGRWRWSKPDKDALKDAIEFIARSSLQ